MPGTKATETCKVNDFLQKLKKVARIASYGPAVRQSDFRKAGPYQFPYNCCRELKRATAYKRDKCSIFSGEKKLFGTNEIAVKQDQ